jgi:outer membrane cobalamin receptor
MSVRETLSHHYTTTYQISLTYLKRQNKLLHRHKNTMVTMEHDTPSHDYTPTYQISLIYRKRQKHYDSDTITLQKYQLFDLEVKCQRQNVVMLVHDTLS